MMECYWPLGVLASAYKEVNKFFRFTHAAYQTIRLVITDNQIIIRFKKLKKKIEKELNCEKKTMILHVFLAGSFLPKPR